MTAVMACIAVLQTAPFAAPQSLGEAARKEKERRDRRREKAGETRVVTGDDLVRAPGTIANPNAPTPASPAPSKDKTTSGTKAGATRERTSREAAERERSDGEYEERERQRENWHIRVREAEARLAAAQQCCDYFEKLHLAPGDWYVDETGKAVIRGPEHLRRLVREAQAELIAARKARDDLDEEARRTGVPPGWLR